MYLLRFIRRDCSPNEEYSYSNRQDAIYHLGLFRNDDSGLYRCVELLKVDGTLETVLDAIRF